MLPETAFHRQLAILPPDSAKQRVTVIGCGGIGSVTALILAKIGVENLVLIDDDKVEIENTPSQFFHQGNVGQDKVAATREHILNFTDIRAEIIVDRCKPEHLQGGIVIAAVDSMAARKEIWDMVKAYIATTKFIDARMGAEKMRIFCLDPHDEHAQQEYEKNLYDDDQAEPEECTAKAIAYNTFVIGGVIGSFVKKILTNQATPREFLFNLDTYGLYKG